MGFLFLSGRKYREKTGDLAAEETDEKRPIPNPSRQELRNKEAVRDAAIGDGASLDGGPVLRPPLTVDKRYSINIQCKHWFKMGRSCKNFQCKTTWK